MLRGCHLSRPPQTATTPLAGCPSAGGAHAPAAAPLRCADVAVAPVLRAFSDGSFYEDFENHDYIGQRARISLQPCPASAFFVQRVFIRRRLGDPATAQVVALQPFTEAFRITRPRAADTPGAAAGSGHACDYFGLPHHWLQNSGALEIRVEAWAEAALPPGMHRGSGRDGVPWESAYGVYALLDTPAGAPILARGWAAVWEAQQRPAFTNLYAATEPEASLELAPPPRPPFLLLNAPPADSPLAGVAHDAALTMCAESAANHDQADAPAQADPARRAPVAGHIDAGAPSPSAASPAARAEHTPPHPGRGAGRPDSTFGLSRAGERRATPRTPQREYAGAINASHAPPPAHDPPTPAAASRSTAAAPHAAEPQPDVGAGAAFSVAEAAAGGVAAMLARDRSPLALCPADPNVWRAIELRIRDATELAAAASTRKAHASAWRRYWLPFCSMLRTSPWRCSFSDATTHWEQYRETWLQTAFFLYVFEHMRPRSHRRDPLPRPQSAMNVLVSIRSIHRHAGFTLLPVARLKVVFRGLQRRFIEAHPDGAAGLVPRRRDPFPRAAQAALLTVPDGTARGRLTVDRSRRAWQSLFLGAKISRATGQRRADVFGHGQQPAHLRLTYHNVVWLIKGAHLRDPSDAQLAAVGRGDAVGIIPTPCKNDQTGQHFMSQPIWVTYSATDAHCAAKALAAYELAHRVRGPARKATPLLPDESGRPLSADTARAMFDVCLHHVFGAEARRFSWHSWRVTLACALLAVGATQLQICRLVRWVGESSLDIYARLDPREQMSLRRRALAADPTGVSVHNLPELRAGPLVQALGDAAATPAPGGETDDAPAASGAASDGADSDSE